VFSSLRPSVSKQRICKQRVCLACLRHSFGEKSARIQFTTYPVRLSDVLHILISSMAVCLKAVASAAPMVSASKVQALALMAKALVLRCWPRLPHWCMLVVNTRFCSTYYYFNVVIFTYCYLLCTRHIPDDCVCQWFRDEIFAHIITYEVTVTYCVVRPHSIVLHVYCVSRRQNPVVLHNNASKSGP